MSLNRYAKKRDVSEPEIVSALTQCGFTVERLDTPVDLLAGFRGRTFLVECKSGKKKLNDNQERFISGWRGSDVVVLRNAQEAIDWAVQVAVETERAA
jgi:Holliday junction resolvase